LYKFLGPHHSDPSQHSSKYVIEGQIRGRNDMNSMPNDGKKDERQPWNGLNVLNDTDSISFTLPTRDPIAALHFCQSLAKILTADPRLSPMNDGRLTEDMSNFIQRDAFNLPALSVVIPVHNEEDNLPTLYGRLSKVLGDVDLEYEIIFVDDGCTDLSSSILQQYVEDDQRVMIVELARNFGHQVAISAGLDYSRGRGVIVMDADLQDPPEILPQFIAKWQEGYGVVYAIREQRKENWFKRECYAAFYFVLHNIAHIEIPLDAGDFCIMDRRVVDQLVRMPERNRFVRGLRSWVGFRQVGLPYERQARYAGQPKYSFKKLVYLALDGFFSFSFIPLRIISLLGLSISFGSILLAIFYAIKKLTSGLEPPGFATLIVSILFLAGMQLVTIGVIGEYVGRIFEEVKQRPLYIARRVISKVGTWAW
jgi:polyisoprenyl-phosphate glycosyltransferase